MTGAGFTLQGLGVDSVRQGRIGARLERLNRERAGPFSVRLFDGAQESGLDGALAAPANVCLDVDCRKNAAFALASADFILRVSTATANRLDVADGLVAALERRFPHLAAKGGSIRYAVQEAVGNAVIHGNLGLDSSLRATMDGLRCFAAALDQGLRDPVRAHLPITILAQLQDDGVMVAVEDRGAGFDPCAVRPPPSAAAGGLGLSIIAKCCRQLSFAQGGRRIVMVF